MRDLETDLVRLCEPRAGDDDCQFPIEQPRELLELAALDWAMLVMAR